MQFAKVQGLGLVVLGLLLLALQLYIFLAPAGPVGSPSQAPAAPTPSDQLFKFAPAIIGTLALAGGGYFVLLQRKQGGSAETQPQKTKSGIPM